MHGAYRPPRDGFYNNATIYGVNMIPAFFSYDIQLMDLRAAFMDVLDSGDQELISFVNNAISHHNFVDTARLILQGLTTVVELLFFTLCCMRLVELRADRLIRRGDISINLKMLMFLTLYSFNSMMMTASDLTLISSNLSDEEAQYIWRAGVVGYILGKWYVNLEYSYTSTYS
jgi:hypothetical protein